MKNKYIEHENYYEIILDNRPNEFNSTKISKDKFELVSKYNWNLTLTGYVLGNYKKTYILLHRLIMLGTQKTSRSIVVDHINRDSLDNITENLRIVTMAQNICNYGKKDPYSKFMNLKLYE